MLDDSDDVYASAPKAAWQRVGFPLLGLAVVAVLVAGGISLLRHKSPSPRPHVEPHIMNVKLPPPPPPPPPPKTPPPPTKTVQAKAAAPTKMAQPKSTPKAPTPPAAVTTSVKGDGPGALANGNGGGVIASVMRAAPVAAVAMPAITTAA